MPGVALGPAQLLLSRDGAMNAIAATTTLPDRLGWTPNIERLARDYEAARSSGRPDPWAIVEAECWLDLIEAELTATATQADPALRAQLLGWRQEIGRLLVRLRALGSPSQSTTRTFSGASVSQRAGERRGPERPGHPAMPRLSQRHGLSFQPNLLEEAS